jgi:4-hydroxybenzoate polyprenyltransferase
MKSIYQFFRLIRFANILVMVLTMFAFYALLFHYSANRQSELFSLTGGNFLAEQLLIDQIGLKDFYFILLIASLVLVAGAGNIINDYFDVKADRVNKPGRLIIGKYVKRRWAIIFNWSFSGIGLLIAIYLSYTLNNWLIALLSFIAINLLYFYSAIFKRKFLIGNILVALLTAIVPIYVLIFGAFSNFPESAPLSHIDEGFFESHIFLVLMYCFFAFVLNLIREIIKDMADVEGDLLLASKTLPIRIGIGKTKVIVGILYMVAIIPILVYVINLPVYIDRSNNALIFTYLLWMVLLFLVFSFLALLFRKEKKVYQLASNLIKFAMLFGVLSALFYA